MLVFLLRAGLAVVSLCAIWIFAGRHIALLLDGVSVSTTEVLPFSLVRSDGSLIQIGENLLSLNSSTAEVSLRVEDLEGQGLTLWFDQTPFLLGTATPEPRIYRTPPHDAAKLIRSHSRLSWPTPFEWNFMTGQSPSWKRHSYYRLDWQKPDGSRLQLVWRFEQWFYDRQGWGSGQTTRSGTTGLIHASLTPGKRTDRPTSP